MNTSNHWKKALQIVISIFLIAIVTGCAGKRLANGPDSMLNSLSFSSGGVQERGVVGDQIEPYRIAPGDTIVVHYYKSYRSNEDEYRMDIGDNIFINVHDQPEYSRNVIILPDGSISLVKVGIIKAQGLTLAELDDVLTKLYGIELINPAVDIFVLEANKKLNDFLDLLFQNSSGTNRTYLVRMDGRIDLPLIEEIEVAGLTLSDAQHRITGKYREKFANLEVNLNVIDSVQARFVILGEVNKPGVYQLMGTINPFYALALAGGGLDTADISKVVILRDNQDNSVEKIFTNLQNTTNWAGSKGDVYVKAGDIIYVPKTGISNIDLFVDQYIRKLLPFSVGTGAYYNLGTK